MSVDKVEAALGALRFISLTASVPPEYDQALSVLTEALAERERDAARYRWLTKVVLSVDGHGISWTWGNGSLDAVIDAAMKDTDHAR